MSEVLVKIDEKNLALLVGLGIAFVAYRRHEPEIKVKGAWMPPASADPYLHTINEATRKYNLPAKLLGRVLYQESRFRPDIISGQVRSSAGAIGIAQIVPKWHPHVDPFDPIASIHYAAAYLSSLHKKFGNWGHALAAYNWGQGNLQKYIDGDIKQMPKETVNYVNEISRDVLV